MLRFDWNYRTNRVKKTAASCQGLATHPNNPFTLASTSRDSTLRIWSLESLTQPLFMRVLAGEPCDSIVTPPGTKKTSCSACGSSVVDSCFRIFALEPFSRANKDSGETPLFLRTDECMKPGAPLKLSGATSRHISSMLAEKKNNDCVKLRWFSELFCVSAMLWLAMVTHSRSPLASGPFHPLKNYEMP